MPPLEDDEKVKLEPEVTIAERVKLNHRKRKNERTGLEILTPNKLLTRLPILLAQMKAGYNSCKLKNEIRQILYFLYQHNKITNNICNNLIEVIIIMEENMIVIRDAKTFCFNFDWPKYGDDNLKREIEFIIKNNAS